MSDIAPNFVKRSVRALHAYVPGEQPKLPDIIKLNTNENPYPPAPGVGALLRSFPAELLRRYPNPTCEALRGQLAGLYGLQPQNVVVGNGSDEILALCTRAFVEDDQKIGFFNPSYSLYPVLSQIRDVQARPTALGPGFEWREPETSGCGLFMLANPNAPSGMAVSPERVRRFCEGFDGVVVIDEAYAEFADQNCLALAGTLPNVLVVRTLSKSYALAGLRLGYALGHAALIEGLLKIKDSYNVSALSQAIAAAALADRDYLADTVARVRATRARLSEALRGMGFEVLPSQTNFVFARPSGLPAREVFESLRQSRILIRHFADEGINAYIRISIGTDNEIDVLLDALRDIISR